VDCVLNIRKESGPTSHDVVDEVRRILGERRVGHAGTLDPMATGVLVVCVGRATRIVEFLMGTPKEYRAEMILGVSTDTEDSTGTVIDQRDASGVTLEMFTKAAAAFVGEIDQVPPMVSAIKQGGKPLYKLARNGQTVERAPRRVTIRAIDVVRFEPGERARAGIVVGCSSGTYIRTICADIGERLGCGASMSALERTRVGRFTLEDSITLERLAEAVSEGAVDRLTIGMDDALVDLPVATVSADDAVRATHGLAVVVESAADEGETVRIIDDDGRLIGVGGVFESDGLKWAKPRKVLSQGEEP